MLFPRKYDEILLNSNSYKMPQAAIINTEINSTGYIDRSECENKV